MGLVDGKTDRNPSYGFLSFFPSTNPLKSGDTTNYNITRDLEWDGLNGIVIGEPSNIKDSRE